MKDIHAPSAAAILLAMAAFTTLFPPAAALAQEGDRPRATDAQEGQDAKVIDVAFPGGTVSEYLDTLRDAAGEINLLIDPRTSQFSMQEVTLVNVSIDAALELVDGLAILDREGEAMRVNVERITSMNQVRTGPSHVSIIEPASSPIYRVSVDVQQTQQRQTKMESRVWSLADLREAGVEPDAVLAAVEVALETQQGEERPQLKFHDETALLIARATSDHTDVIQQVIEQLRNASIGSTELRSLESNAEEAMERWKEAETRRADITSQLLEAERQIARLEAMNQEHEVRHRDNERRVEVAEAAVRSLQEEVMRLNADLAKREGGGEQ